VALATSAPARAAGCSKAQAGAAEEGIARLRTWSDLHTAFRTFQACDDGAIAEGWSEFTVRTLATHWNTVIDLQRLTTGDIRFHRFVLRHIDATGDAGDLRRIAINAGDYCPRAAKDLCRDIADAARQALASASRATNPFARAQAPTFASLDQVVSYLQREKGASALARTLRLQSCGRAQMVSCADTKIRIVHPRLDAMAEAAIIEIQNLQQGDLAAFVRNEDGTWRWVDTFPLAFAYEPLQIEFKSLVRAPVEEIVIHNNSAQWGTGLYFGHFLIVKLLRGRLQVVFAATSKEIAAPPGGTDYEMVSTFQLQPSSEDASPPSRPATVTQTAEYKIGGHVHTVVRKFNWNDTFSMFVPAEGDAIH
ncbi:MAG TPA: hypothetical protein VG871_22535, partial [Vicinamibacterales bacterium]|nr:hypothetical protein [Vicinamibacterales bacterium]